MSAIIAWPLPAAGQTAPVDTRQACLDAHADGQAARNAGRLREARARFLACGGVECAAVLRADCASWLAQVDGDIPSLVFAARDIAGRELTDVRVVVDDAVVAERIDGRAVVVDPGSHRVRFERAGSPAGETTTLVRVGERNRTITATFGDAGGAGSSKGSWIGPIALGAVAVVGVAGFAFFGLRGKSQKHDLEDACSPRCSPDDTSASRTSFVLADVSLVVGVLALGGAAAWLAITHPWQPATARPTQVGAATARRP
jgi:hypothetical protein